MTHLLITVYVPYILLMAGQLKKNPYPTLFAYNNFKQPRNVRSSASVVKRKRDIPEESDAVERREKTTVTEACSIDLVGPHIVSL